MRVFVAGASGAIGEPLITELLKSGHSVVGMTTNEERAKNLERQGAAVEHRECARCHRIGGNAAPVQSRSRD